MLALVVERLHSSEFQIPGGSLLVPTWRPCCQLNRLLLAASSYLSWRCFFSKDKCAGRISFLRSLSGLDTSGLLPSKRCCILGVRGSASALSFRGANLGLD
jgi:hypothetical protein